MGSRLEGNAVQISKDIAAADDPGSGPISRRWSRRATRARTPLRRYGHRTHARIELLLVADRSWLPVIAQYRFSADA